MKNKKLSLNVWMYLKIIPIAIITAFYFLDVRVMSNHPLHTAIIFIIFAGLGLFFHYTNKKDLFDESAKESLRRTDSICLKIVFVLAIIIVFCQFITSAFDFRFYLDEASPPIHSLLDLPGVVLGYGVVFMILILTILRAFIFSIVDRRGI
jgi:hypothetical protein